MAIGKRARQEPARGRPAVAESVDLAPMAGKPEVAGPGFLNVRLLDEWISRGSPNCLSTTRRWA